MFNMFWVQQSVKEFIMCQQIKYDLLNLHHCGLIYKTIENGVAKAFTRHYMFEEYYALHLIFTAFVCSIDVYISVSHLVWYDRNCQSGIID